MRLPIRTEAVTQPVTGGFHEQAVLVWLGVGSERLEWCRIEKPLGRGRRDADASELDGVWSLSKLWVKLDDSLSVVLTDDAGHTVGKWIPNRITGRK